MRRGDHHSHRRPRRLALSHFSTALAALAERAHGDAPTTAEALAAAQAAVNPDALLSLATLIHLVAYPAISSWTGGVVLTLAADGSRQVSESRGTRSARWVQDGDGLTLTLDTPLSTTFFSGDLDPLTQEQVEVRSDVTAYRLKLLPGGLVTLTEATTQTPLSGTRTGQVETLSQLSDPGSAWRLAVNPAAAAPLAAADFAPGKRWAGIVASGGYPPELGNRDMLDITAAGSGRALRTGTGYTVETAGAAFTLRGSDGSHLEYLRVGDAGAGAAHFIVFDRGAAELKVYQTVLVPPGEALVFDAASASRAWRWDLPAGQAPSDVVLRADGTGTYLGQAATWRVLDDGRLRILRPTAGGTRQSRYDWIPLRRGSDGSVWVLRHLVSENPANPVPDGAPGQLWLVFRYRGTGPGI